MKFIRRTIKKFAWLPVKTISGWVWLSDYFQDQERPSYFFPIVFPGSPLKNTAIATALTPRWKKFRNRKHNIYLIKEKIMSDLSAPMSKAKTPQDFVDQQIEYFKKELEKYKRLKELFETNEEAVEIYKLSRNW